MRKMELLAAFALFAAASPALAQGRGHGHDRDGDRDRVPPGQMPPAGMCRVWIDGVPPGRQPAPTDCGTAAANVPANGRIIYGPRTNAQYPYSTYPSRRVYTSNGQVINRQGCVQRVDANGRMWTTCPNGGVYNNGRYYPNQSQYPYGYPNGQYQYGYPNGQYQNGYPNGERERDREWDREHGHGKHKHHDHDQDDDHDGDRDN